MKRSKRAQCGPLTAPEKQGAHLEFLRGVQEESFEQEIRDIVSNGQVQKSSPLKNLTPFVDDLGLLRVGGMLSQSEIPEDKKFPILLPKCHYFTRLIIRQSHEENIHCGTQQPLCAIPQQYWIPADRSEDKKYVRQCVKCQRFSMKVTVQKMGDLPEERTTPSRPFTHTGLDFAGPLTIRHGQEDVQKTYAALFVCFATKAMLLELVSDLSKEARLSAIRQFTSLRRLPNVIYSNNGTNFTGVRNELMEVQRLLARQVGQDDLEDYCANKGISWVTIPTRAPHLGGL